MPPGNKKYVILNGHYYDAGNPVLSTQNRAFRYGDGLFETMRCHQTRPLFFQHHYHRLMRGMAILHLIPVTLPPMESLLAMIEKLIVRNRIFTDARVRLSVFRRPGGLYTPTDNSAAFLLEATPLPDKGYHLNKKGLTIGAYSGFPVSLNPISPFKSLSATPYILAGIYKQEKGWDDALITNQQNYFAEAVSSNLFWVNGGKIYTPAITSGCVEGIMRKNVLTWATQQNIAVKETFGATREDLLSAEEIFLTNTVSGVRWVVAYEEKRYFNRLPKKITEWLNEQINE